MKKSLILFFMALIMLSLPACSSGGSEEKLIGEIDFGVTQNQVIEQLGYSNDYYYEHNGTLTYDDIKIFDQYCKFADFWFEDNELTSIDIFYPSGADSGTIIKALEKSYGKTEDYSTDERYYWSFNNATIVFSSGDDYFYLAIYKSED